MKKIILTFLFAISSMGVFSQSNNYYQTAVGIKITKDQGIYYDAISIKQSVGDQKYFELNTFLLNPGLRLIGVYEVYGNVQRTTLQWYYGYGAHVQPEYSGKNSQYGPDGVLGLDLKISGSPIDISLDFNPSLELTVPKFAWWGGPGIRYVFK